MFVSSGCFKRRPTPDPVVVLPVFSVEDEWTFVPGSLGIAQLTCTGHKQTERDRTGKMLQRREWKEDGPLSHTVFGYDEQGRVVLEDRRLENGRVGPVYLTHHEPGMSRMLKLNGRGFVVEKEETEFGEGGEVLEVSRVVFPDPVEEPGKSVFRTFERQCGRSGDTVFSCFEVNGQLTSKEGRVFGRKVYWARFDDTGGMVEEGRVLMAGSLRKWEVRDPSGRLRSAETNFEGVENDQVSCVLREKWDEAGALRSRFTACSRQEDGISEERSVDYLPDGDSLVVERRTFLHGAGTGTRTMEVVFDHGTCSRVVVRELHLVGEN